MSEGREWKWETEVGGMLRIWEVGDCVGGGLRVWLSVEPSMGERGLWEEAAAATLCSPHPQLIAVSWFLVRSWLTRGS